MRIVPLREKTKSNIMEDLLKRSPNQYDEYQDTVNAILKDVKENGDKAVFSYTEKFDRARISPSNLYVSEAEIEEAYRCVDPSLIEVMKKSLANIKDFHEKQIRNSWFTTRDDGVILGQRITPLSSVGVYVPGGKAAYPSSVWWKMFRHAAGTGRKGQSGYACGGSLSRGDGGMQGRRGAGGCRSRLWDGIHTQGG